MNVLAASAWAEDLTLSRIDVSVTGNTDEKVVRGAFLEVTEGRTYPRTVLEGAVQEVQDRLVNLNYFSSVLVTLVVSQKTPGTARIVVEVTDGFTARYGGGPIFGMVGGVNAGGRGEDWYVALGLNRQSFDWTSRYPGWTGGSWELDAGNAPWDWIDSSGTVQEDHLAGAKVRVTQALGWGWSTAAFQDTHWDLIPDYSTGSLRTAQGAELTWDRSAPGFSPDRGTKVLGRFTGIFPGHLYREEGDARAYFALGGGVKLAFRAAVATQQGDFATKDALALTGFDSLRQPFTATDLVRTAAWSSAELRWAVARVPFLGFTTLDVEPALVADFGGALRWDAGVGLRLFLDIPVDLPIRIEYTVDNQHRTWFGVTLENPF